MSNFGEFVSNLPDGSRVELLNGDTRVLFGPESSGPSSHVFAVASIPYVIRAFNLRSGQTVAVDMVAGAGSGTMYAPHQINGAPAVLTTLVTSLTITTSGRYRARVTGSADPGAVYVDAYPSGTHNSGSNNLNNYGT